jgi:hypothetical protein
VAKKISSDDSLIANGKWQPSGSTRVQSRGIMSHDRIAKSTAREIPQYQGIPENPLRSPKNEVVEGKEEASESCGCGGV